METNHGEPNWPLHTVTTVVAATLSAITARFLPPVGPAAGISRPSRHARARHDPNRPGVFDGSSTSRLPTSRSAMNEGSILLLRHAASDWPSNQERPSSFIPGRHGPSRPSEAWLRSLICNRSNPPFPSQSNIENRSRGQPLWRGNRCQQMYHPPDTLLRSDSSNVSRVRASTFWRYRSWRAWAFSIQARS